MVAAGFPVYPEAMTSDVLVGIVVFVLVVWLLVAWRISAALAKKGIVVPLDSDHDLVGINMAAKNALADDLGEPNSNINDVKDEGEPIEKSGKGEV